MEGPVILFLSDSVSVLQLCFLLLQTQEHIGRHWWGDPLPSGAPGLHPLFDHFGTNFRFDYTYTYTLICFAN